MKYSFICGIAVGIIAAALIWRKSGDTKQEAGPEETVGTFCRMMVSGDFAGACALCDTMTMKDYIGAYAQVWEMQHSQDSSAVATTAGILSGMDIRTEAVIKDGDRRLVHFTIAVNDDMTKKKTATLRKEGRQWRVEGITDRN